MMLLWGFLRRFAVFARRKWWKVLFRSNDHCILCWPSFWARCWMLQDMDHMEASCVFYVKVGRFHQLEQTKISVLTVTSLGIVILTVHEDLMVSVWFMKNPDDVLSQTSADILYVEGCPFYIYQKWDFSCRSSRYNSANNRRSSNRLPANRGTVGIPCSYTQPDSASIECASWQSLVPFWLVASHIIFRTFHFFWWSSSSPFHNSKSWLQKDFNQMR